MFKKKTLFILGAGASCPYGYPTGKELIQDIIRDIEDDIFIPILQDSKKYNFNPNSKDFDLEDFESDIKQIDINTFEPKQPRLVDIWGHEQIYVSNDKKFYKTKISTIKQFYELKKVLMEFDPVSIDTFLRDNHSHAKYGRIMINYSLLKKENPDKFSMDHETINSRQVNEKDEQDKQDKQDNWYSYLLNDILAGCADKPKNIMDNELSIVTFNYDLSLDYYLYKRLNQIEIFKGGEGNEFWQTLVDKKRIKHVYGQLYNYDEIENYGNFANRTYDEAVCNARRFFTACHNQENIWLMNRNHDSQKVHYTEIENLVKEAKEIIIIGFGFDRDNLDKLGFPNERGEYSYFFTYETPLNFRIGKTIKYLDYAGKMKALGKQFDILDLSLRKPHVSEEGSIIRSEAKRITDAYQNDFRIFLY